MNLPNSVAERAKGIVAETIRCVIASFLILSVILAILPWSAGITSEYVNISGYNWRWTRAGSNQIVLDLSGGGIWAGGVGIKQQNEPWFNNVQFIGDGYYGQAGVSYTGLSPASDLGYDQLFLEAQGAALGMALYYFQDPTAQSTWVRDAVMWARSQGYVAVYAIGYSAGASVFVDMIEQEPNFDAVVAIGFGGFKYNSDPVKRCDDWQWTSNYSTFEPTNIRTRVIFIAGDADPISPNCLSKNVDDRITRAEHTLVTVPTGTDHNGYFLSSLHSTLVNTIRTFLSNSILAKFYVNGSPVLKGSTVKVVPSTEFDVQVIQGAERILSLQVTWETQVVTMTKKSVDTWTAKIELEAGRSYAISFVYALSGGTVGTLGLLTIGDSSAPLSPPLWLIAIAILSAVAIGLIVFSKRR